MGKDWMTFMKRSNLEVAGALFSPQEQSHVYMAIAIFLVKLLKTRMQLESWCQYQQKSNDGFSNNEVLVKYQKRNAILLVEGALW